MTCSGAEDHKHLDGESELTRLGRRLTSGHEQCRQSCPKDTKNAEKSLTSQWTDERMDQVSGVDSLSSV